MPVAKSRACIAITACHPRTPDPRAPRPRPVATRRAAAGAVPTNTNPAPDTVRGIREIGSQHVAVLRDMGFDGIEILRDAAPKRCIVVAAGGEQPGPHRRHPRRMLRPTGTPGLDGSGSEFSRSGAHRPGPQAICYRPQTMSRAAELPCRKSKRIADPEHFARGRSDDTGVRVEASKLPTRRQRRRRARWPAAGFPAAILRREGQIMICDVHAHYIPKQFSDFMGDRFIPAVGAAKPAGIARHPVSNSATDIQGRLELAGSRRSRNPDPVAAPPTLLAGRSRVRAGAASAERRLCRAGGTLSATHPVLCDAAAAAYRRLVAGDGAGSRSARLCRGQYEHFVSGPLDRGSRVRADLLPSESARHYSVRASLGHRRVLPGDQRLGVRASIGNSIEDAMFVAHMIAQGHPGQDIRIFASSCRIWAGRSRCC